MISAEKYVSLIIAGGVLVVAIAIYYMWLVADTRKKHRELREEVETIKRSR